MSPIRVAIIGLSSSAVTAWASTAHLPYLLSPKGKEKYKIVALCNSSVNAARSAINAYKLPASTRAYGDPAALAQDEDIDLVVCCTRVDRHYETIRPSIEAGKSVMVEWPLAQDMPHITNLVNLAREKGVRTMVGLQGRVAPVILKLRELIDEGHIGKVLSSEVRAAGGLNDRVLVPEGIKYFLNRAVGGNVFTIGFGHLFDFVQETLGTMKNISSTLQIQYPINKVRDPRTNDVTETVESNVPDIVVVSGSLSGSNTTQNNATVLIRFRRGAPFPGETPLVWTINGEKGEIRLNAEGGTTLHASAYSAPVTIELHNFETNKVSRVDWQWEPWQADLPMVARSVGKIYEIFAGSKDLKYPTFGDALGRHVQLAAMLSKWDAESSV